ncbi:DUF3304 domain-containing protein [Ralstonia pseudosolanacearum]|nr:DUF3304 domain-containing protein [Ralstonia pseudosolanacearum]
MALLVPLILLGCQDHAGRDDSAQAKASTVDDYVPPISGGGKGLNYSKASIERYSAIGDGVEAGGSGMNPIHEDGDPGDAGEVCCSTFPGRWKPGMKVTIEWQRDKHPFDDNDRTGLQWLKAVAPVPEYDGRHTYGFWAIFLPGDRVKVAIADGNANGHNSVRTRPSDNDPYVVQGVLDEELNKEKRQ